MRSASLLTASSLVAAFALAPAAADAATTLTIRGAGFGHGVGMSQYGTLGYARAGADYRTILAHYYTGTGLGALQGDPEVRVLLGDGRKTVTLVGVAALGDQALDPAVTYTAVPGGDGVVLKQGKKKLFTAVAPVRIAAPAGGSFLFGGARYRGAVELRPSSGGLMVVNAVGLEDYVSGVVGRESPSSWPIEALRTQAVAARTYAVATAKAPGSAFDQYRDTRSQVYGGVAAETASTEQAVSSTAGQVVTYQGRPIVTYFFSTSGGRTENVENSFMGSSPKPWLKSVDDPYDSLSPRHRWTPLKLTAKQAQARLGSLLKGKYVRIDVTRRGVSPRIVSATIVGTKGKTVTSGPTLRRVFGLADTWAYFTTVTTGVQKPVPATPEPGATPAPVVPPASPSTGGAGMEGARAAAVRAGTSAALSGTVAPAPKGAWIRIQRLSHGRWKTAAETRLGAGGSYRVTAPRAGTYRVRYADVVGPSVVVR